MLKNRRNLPTVAILSCLLLLGALFALRVTRAQSTVVFHNFTGQDGGNPFIGMIQINDGTFYGATGGGGFGCGTLYKIAQNGILTTLHSFSANGIDGCGPATGLVQATDGYFYGTTSGGGTGGNNGTIYRIDQSGNFLSLLSFDGTNGRQPSRLIQASDGMLYGTTSSSGAANPGTVFRLDAAANLTTLHFFSVSEGSQMREYGLVQANDGDFYGTAAHGGSPACPQAPTFQSGCGTVFKIDVLGNLSVLHSFTGTDGNNPYSGLIQASDGKFYGTTLAGGSFDMGTIFRIGEAGNFESLHEFDGNDGREPVRILQASDGNLYGTTKLAPGFGSIFKMDPQGNIFNIHTFNFSDGYLPFWVIQANDGRLFGTTSRGGSSDLGVIFVGPSAGPPLPTPTPTPTATPTPTSTPTPTPSPTVTPTPTPSPTPQSLVLNFATPPNRIQSGKPGTIGKVHLEQGLQWILRGESLRWAGEPGANPYGGICYYEAVRSANVALGEDILDDILVKKLAAQLINTGLGGIPTTSVYQAALLKAGKYLITLSVSDQQGVDSIKFATEQIAPYLFKDAVSKYLAGETAGELTEKFLNDVLDLKKVTTIDLDGPHYNPALIPVHIRIMYAIESGFVTARVIGECEQGRAVFIFRYEPSQEARFWPDPIQKGQPYTRAPISVCTIGGSCQPLVN